MMDAQVCMVLIVPGVVDTCREETRPDRRLKASVIENVDELSELLPGSFNGLEIMMKIGGRWSFGRFENFVAVICLDLPFDNGCIPYLLWHGTSLTASRLARLCEKIS